jgi:DnaJ-class molecular chaperone
MNLYAILGVSRESNAQQIRDAYKVLVRKEHPDKGGDAEKFKKIQKAYDVLSDDGKRMHYDQTGQLPDEGQDNGQMHGGMQGGMPFGFGQGIPMNVGNIFNMFNGMPQQRRRREGKAPPRVSHIPLTLRDFYNGRSFQIQLERQRFCKDCKGDGSTTMKTCAGCNGIGAKKQMIQMGPFMMENNTVCELCNGSGKQKGDNCWTCKGSCFVKEEKTLEIRIEPGMGNGNTIVFNGESSDTSDYAEAGDVVIELQSADETTPWNRKGDDLHTTVKISFSESLVGCSVRISNHPGYDSSVVFTILPGVINGEAVTVKGYGMPKRGSSIKGNAILTVSINKPSSLEQENLVKARELLTNLFQVSQLVKQEGDHVA